MSFLSTAMVTGTHWMCRSIYMHLHPTHGRNAPVVSKNDKLPLEVGSDIIEAEELRLGVDNVAVHPSPFPKTQGLASDIRHEFSFPLKADFHFFYLKKSREKAKRIDISPFAKHLWLKSLNVWQHFNFLFVPLSSQKIRHKSKWLSIFSFLLKPSGINFLLTETT